MLGHLWWFMAGGWIGSFFTSVMVALLRSNREVSKPYDEETAPHDLAVKT